MQVEVHGQNIRVGDRMHDLVDRQFDFALGQFDSWINDVSVHLEDVNGQRGGIDKQCRVLVNLKGGKTVKIEDIDVDFVAAINRAADRASQAVGREVAKRREKHAEKPSHIEIVQELSAEFA